MRSQGSQTLGVNIWKMAPTSLLRFRTGGHMGNSEAIRMAFPVVGVQSGPMRASILTVILTVRRPGPGSRTRTKAVHVAALVGV
jgi:hypothetical protein